MNRWAVRRVTIALIGVLALAVPAAPAGALAPRHDWHVTATLALGVDDTAVSCAGTTCWTLEAGQLLSSTDGGTSWRSRRSAVPDGIAAFNDVDCPSVTVCYFLATTDAQVSVVVVERRGVMTVHDVGATTAWISISCPGPKHCVATDGYSSFTTRDAWDSFAAHPYAEALYGSADIGCAPGTNTCSAVGDFGETPRIEHTTNDGATWTPQSVPVPSDGMYAVACPTTDICYAGGADFSDYAIVLRTIDAGKHWNFASLSTLQRYAVRSISCVAATTCWGEGATPGNTPFVYATTDGLHWDKQTIGAIASEQKPRVSCFSATQCALVEGGTAYKTTTGGDAWTAQSIPAAIEAPRAMTCPSTTHCVALTNDATGVAQTIVSDDGGTTWLPHGFPAGAGGPMDVRCAAVDACFATTRTQIAAGGAPITHVWRSTDGGVTWRPGHLEKRRGELGRLACPSPTTCMVVGYDAGSRPKAEVTTDGGKNWHEIALPVGANAIEGTACSAVDACVLIARVSSEQPQAFTTSDLGGSYEPHVLPGLDGNAYLGAMDCAATTCLAVGSTSGSALIERSVDAGVTWKASTLPQSVDSPSYVACVSSTRCAMTAYNYRPDHNTPVVAMSENGGKSWRLEPIPARREAPLGLACHATGCIASDVSLSANPIILAGSF